MNKNLLIALIVPFLLCACNQEIKEDIEILNSLDSGLPSNIGPQEVIVYNQKADSASLVNNNESSMMKYENDKQILNKIISGKNSETKNALKTKEINSEVSKKVSKASSINKNTSTDTDSAKEEKNQLVISNGPSPSTKKNVQIKNEDYIKENEVPEIEDNPSLLKPTPSTNGFIFEAKKAVFYNATNNLTSTVQKPLAKTNGTKYLSPDKMVEQTKKNKIDTKLNLETAIGTSEDQKNNQSQLRTNFEEENITNLFSSSEAHSKKYKKERPIKTLQAKGEKSGSKQTIKYTTTTTSTGNIAKPLLRDSTERKVNKLNISSKSDSYTSVDLNLRVLRKQNSYKTNKNHTLLLEVTNTGNFIEPIELDVEMPEDWQIISISPLASMDTNERKFCFVSFYIPTQSTSGKNISTFLLKTNNYIIQAFDFELNVEDNNDLEVFNISAPKQLEAGETIESIFGIRNNGNVDQELSLLTRNTLEGEANVLLAKDSTLIVKVVQKTNANSNVLQKRVTNLDVLSNASGQTYYISKTIEVIPTKIASKDPFLRYPMSASIYYNSYTNEVDHYSTISGELKGNGFLDEARDHHLNFTIRAPKKTNIRRFNVVDQYSLVYRYKKRATLYLGDHSYYLNRLGFGSRYGVGFKLDYNIKNWRLSTFYSKPRLYNFRSKALYGFRADYFIDHSQNFGITLEKSQGYVYSFRNLLSEQGKGEILTLDYDYEDDNTFVDAEISSSYNGKEVDYASNINFTQKIKNFRYSNNILYASENYIGNISNSLQLTNSLYFNKKGFNMGLGHAFSQVNRRLDPVIFETEPYFESYFASMGYRFANKHHLNFRFDKQIREDQLEPKNYHYEEYGFNYNFVYTDKLFTGSFGGRFAKSKNLLTQTNAYKNTYSHHLNVSYKIFKNFNIRGGLNQIYTGRYGLTDQKINFVRYNFGFNYKISDWLRVNSNYNSGFSPEENYKQREYINMNLVAQINRRHRFEVRGSYFERPGVINNKELFVYGKYTYSFGIGMKRLIEQGGIEGNVFTDNDEINIKGIKLYTSGKALLTDRYGNFEFNNLPVGKNYIFIDDSSLPLNVVSNLKNPIEIEISSDRKNDIKIELVKSGSLYGTLKLNNSKLAIETNVSGYIKIENSDFTHYADANDEGEFKFQNIVPGEYKLTIMRFKKNDNLFKLVKEYNVIVTEGKDTEVEIGVTGKERKFRFKDNNLKVGYND